MDRENPKSKLVLMRIYIGEPDTWEQKPLREVLLDLFHCKGLSGVRVMRRREGYDFSSGYLPRRNDAETFPFFSDFALIVEVVERAEQVERVLPKVLELIDVGRVVTLESARPSLCRTPG